ncbi:MAG: iron-containing alcohol dehydrogenase, partial [Lysobacterales bacterium]
MNPTANWNYPTPIKFGAGRIRELPEHCRAQGILRPLLVTDAGLADAPITRDALQSLQAAGLAAALF